MRKNTHPISLIRKLGLAIGTCLGIGLASVPAIAISQIDSEADKILRSMSTYLGGLSTFSVKADIDTEVVNLEGQKIQISGSSEILVERPNRLHARRQGAIADVALIFDGSTLTIHEKEHNAYFQTKAKGNVDDVLDFVRVDIGLDAPAADLLYVDSYASLSSGVVSSTYLGTAYVNGVESHHLLFRENQLDWQIWVKAGDEPLPMKYIITTKWLTGAPQHSVRFRDWNTEPKVDPGQFAFSAPSDARKLEMIPVDELGEPNLEELK